MVLLSNHLHEAVLEATNHGIKTLGNDVIIREWGKGIQEVMESYEIEIELDHSSLPITRSQEDKDKLKLSVQSKIRKGINDRVI